MDTQLAAKVAVRFPMCSGPSCLPIRLGIRYLRRQARTSAVSEAANAISPRREPSAVTQEARTLYASSVRRIWSTLLDYRDWVSYLYVPIMIPILVLLPYFVIDSYKRSHRANQIVESLAQGSRDLEKMTELLEGPVEPWIGERDVEDLQADDKPDLTGFLILQDSRIVDLRHWTPTADGGSNPTRTYMAIGG